jgi:hypothetical protein
MSDEWYYETDGDVHGPVTGQELLLQANAGVILQDTPVCKGSNGQWIQASRVKGLGTACQRTPTKPCPFCGEAILPVAKKCKHCGEFLDEATSSNGTQSGKSNKRILPLFLLYLFFGILGVHAFYAGRTALGIFYLLAIPLTIIGFGAMNSVRPDSTLLLHTMAGLLIFALPVCAIRMIIDLIQIITGVYKDGNGQRISKWT